MLRLSLLLFALLAAGCYDDAGVPAPKNDPLPEANLSLPDLSARCGDTPVRIVQDIVVAGRVTTSDEAGNFFRSVVLQEDGTGVELMAGLDDLFRVYPRDAASRCVFRGWLCAVASEWCRSVRCLRREIMPWKPSVSVPCSTGTSLAKPSMFSVPFPGSSLSTNLRPTCAAAWCRSRI